MPGEYQHKPFPWCAMQAMSLVYKWMANRVMAGTAKRTDQIEIIFQKGDKDRGDFLDAAYKVYKYRPTFTGSRDAVPFQACDYLAWEHRNWLTVWTTRPDAKPSYANVMLARRLAFDSQLYADWATLSRHAAEHGYRKRK